ncbi:MAG: HesA/MoeB/ThiF family protein [Candidatus Omnitrophota bacterium]
MSLELTTEQLDRYKRQIAIEDVGLEGQKKLLVSKVLIIGAGGLGSPAALYLAAGGVGKIGLLDSEKVELSNLQRQILHYAPDIGKFKVSSGKEKLNSLNPCIEVIAYNTRLTDDSALGIIAGYDVVLDCSDNFKTKFLANGACVFLNKPLILGAAAGFNAQVTTIIPRVGPCYRCLFPEPPAETVSEKGIFGPVCGVTGSLQANEALKYLLGTGDLLTGKLLMFDGLRSSFKIAVFTKDKDCPVCGK